MMKTVAVVASARKKRRPVCSPSWRNSSSGPYADDDSPSAPSPTHASSAISESLWKACGSRTSFGGPKRKRRRRPGIEPPESSRGGRSFQRFFGPSSRTCELDRLLRAGLDALAARFARRRPRCVCGLPPVGEALELPEHAEPAEVGVVDPPDVEDIDRADLDALGLALALGAIDDGGELSGVRTAVGGAGGSRE